MVFERVQFCSSRYPHSLSCSVSSYMHLSSLKKPYPYTRTRFLYFCRSTIKQRFYRGKLSTSRKVNVVFRITTQKELTLVPLTLQRLTIIEHSTLQEVKLTSCYNSLTTLLTLPLRSQTHFLLQFSQDSTLHEVKPTSCYNSLKTLLPKKSNPLLVTQSRNYYKLNNKPRKNQQRLITLDFN